jgi:membrane protease YdiL (CAAX protease family)
LHFPSAFLDLGYDLPRALFRFVQTGLSGFILGYVYWRTGSVLPTIALHGLQNFTLSISLHLSGVTATQMLASQIPFQLLWLVGQAGLMPLVCRALFGGKKQGDVKT